MAGLVESFRAPIDSVYTIFKGYHSEIGMNPNSTPEDPDSPVTTVLHYRPWGVILHDRNSKGKFLGREEASSGKALIEALNLIIPQTPLELAKAS